MLPGTSADMLHIHAFLTLGAHVHESYSTHFVCVCPPFSGSIKRLYNTLITEIGFVLNAKDFQLTDFSEKASFESYSLFCSFYKMVAIFLLIC